MDAQLPVGVDAVDGDAVTQCIRTVYLNTSGCIVRDLVVYEQTVMTAMIDGQSRTIVMADDVVAAATVGGLSKGREIS